MTNKELCEVVSGIIIKNSEVGLNFKCTHLFLCRIRKDEFACPSM